MCLTISVLYFYCLGKAVFGQPVSLSKALDYNDVRPTFSGFSTRGSPPRCQRGGATGIALRSQASNSVRVVVPPHCVRKLLQDLRHHEPKVNMQTKLTNIFKHKSNNNGFVLNMAEIKFHQSSSNFISISSSGSSHPYFRMYQAKPTFHDEFINISSHTFHQYFITSCWHVLS